MFPLAGEGDGAAGPDRGTGAGVGSVAFVAYGIRWWLSTT